MEGEIRNGERNAYCTHVNKGEKKRQRRELSRVRKFDVILVVLHESLNSRTELGQLLKENRQCVPEWRWWMYSKRNGSCLAPETYVGLLVT